MRGKAAELEGNLETAGWEIFEAIGKLDDERKATAEAILADVRQALAADEHVRRWRRRSEGAHARAVRLLTKPCRHRAAASRWPAMPAGPAEPRIASGPRARRFAREQDLALAEPGSVLAELNGRSSRADRSGST